MGLEQTLRRNHDSEQHQPTEDEAEPASQEDESVVDGTEGALTPTMPSSAVESDEKRGSLPTEATNDGLSTSSQGDQSRGRNTVTATHFRANWIGLFSGENQSKAVERALNDLNTQGLTCCGLALDLWNPFVRLWWFVVSILTLGFVVKVPDVLIVTEPGDSSVPVTNAVVASRIRVGWVGLFSGENQAKALQRVISQINEDGQGCCGIVRDRWNPFVRLGWFVVGVLSLGFYVRVPNVLVITKSLSSRGGHQDR